jgi:hypothetical protein
VTVVVDVVDHQVADRDVTGATLVDGASEFAAGALADQPDLGSPHDDLVVHGASHVKISGGQAGTRPDRRQTAL